MAETAADWQIQVPVEGNCDAGKDEKCVTVVFTDPKKPDVRQYYCRCSKTKVPQPDIPETTERPPGRLTDCGNIKLVEEKVRLEGDDEFTLKLTPVCPGACDKPKVCRLQLDHYDDQMQRNPDGSFTRHSVITYKCECQMPRDADDDDE